MHTTHKHIIQLSKKELDAIHSIIRRGTHSARVMTRARILLLSHKGKSKKVIAVELEINPSTVQDVRNRYRESMDRALYDAPRSGQPPKLDDAAEAHLVAVACSDPPEDASHWTLELLRKRLIADKKVKTISTVAIWQHLNDRGIKPWREKNVVRANAHAGVH